jgi:hypothetical protein
MRPTFDDAVSEAALALLAGDDPSDVCAATSEANGTGSGGRLSCSMVGGRCTGWRNR